MTADFFGRGLNVPLQFGPAGLAEAAAVAKVEQSMRVVLGTGLGERVMRPDFGCGLNTLVFAPNDESTANLARYHVTQGLTKWEPRIDVIDVAVQADNAAASMIITISYRLRATQDLHNLVYPFFLEHT